VRAVRRPGWIAALMFAVCGIPSVAAAGRQLAIVAGGSCPTGDAVMKALAEAMPDATLVDGATEAARDAEPVVVISDGSASYRAVIGGTVRTLVDPELRCDERARKVAVVAALALEPPQIATATPAVREAVVARPAPPTAGLGARFQVGGAAEYSQFRHNWPFPVGATVRAIVGNGVLGVAVGAALVTSVVLDNDWSLQRIPIDVAAQVRYRAGWIAGAVELGPGLVVRMDRRVDRGTAFGPRAVQMEADYRLAGQIELWPSRRYGVFATLGGTFVSNPVATPNGDPMPRYWLLASAGLVIEAW